MNYNSAGGTTQTAQFTTPTGTTSFYIAYEVRLDNGKLTYNNIVLKRLTPPGVTITRSYYGLAGQTIAVRVANDPLSTNNGLWQLHSDHLGSSRLMSDSAGAVKLGSTTRFLPYGGYRTTPTTGITDRGFTGHQMQDELGLVYMRARWFVPGVGRFASADTIVPEPANPQSHNRFSYVRNNPLKFTDPSGHSECEDIGAGCEPLPPPPPLPPSYVRISMSFRLEGGRILERDRAVGAAIDSNAILTHNHLVPPGFTASQVENVTVYDASGNTLLSTSDGFLIGGSDDLGGGLGLIVFEEDFTTDPNTASLGTVTDSIVGRAAQQAVRVGAENRDLLPGLYSTTVQSINSPRHNLEGVEYNALQVSSDLTIPGDSGSPLFIDGRVYAVNNAGYGVYGPVVDIALIRELVAVMTNQLR